MFCHPFSLLFEFHLLLLLEPLQPSHLLLGACCLQESWLSDGLQIQLIPPFFYNIPLLARERLGYVLDCTVEPNRCHISETRRAHDVSDACFILVLGHSWPGAVRSRPPLLVQDHHIRRIPSPCSNLCVPFHGLVHMSVVYLIPPSASCWHIHNLNTTATKFLDTLSKRLTGIHWPTI